MASLIVQAIAQESVKSLPEVEVTPLRRPASIVSRFDVAMEA
ncbi:MAG: hypothetical protein ABI884_10675 [Gemmatimonadota bacterium]